MERPLEQNRPFIIIGEVDRVGGRPVLELAAPHDLVLRRTLWPGLPPPAVPSHPGLLPIVLAGRLDSQPVWLEARPLGCTLKALGELSEEETFIVLDDLIAALRTLHDRSQSHGSVRPSRVLITTEGQAIFLGTGSHSGQVHDDIADLVRLGRALDSESLDLPETVPSSLEAIAERIRALRQHINVSEVRAALGKRANGRISTVPKDAPELGIAVVDGSAVQPVDEVGIDLGFGDNRYEPSSSWSGTASEVTGEATGELTASCFPGSGKTRSRAQTIARVLASPSFPIDPGRFTTHEGRRCTSISALLAEEAPDPLPIGEDRSITDNDEDEHKSWLPQAMADLAILDRPTASGVINTQKTPAYRPPLQFAPSPEFDDITETTQQGVSEIPESTDYEPTAPIPTWRPDLTPLEKYLLLIIFMMTLGFLIFDR